MITFLLACIVVRGPWKPPYEVVDPPSDVSRLVREMGGASTKVILKGDRLTFLSKGETNGIALPDWMRPTFTHDSADGVWVAQLLMADWNRAFFTYGVTNGKKKERPVFRGPLAPKAPLASKTLEGRVKTVIFDSKALGGLRDLTIYLPPGEHRNLDAVYMLDGQSCEAYARILEPLILAKVVAPTAIIGLHHGPNLGTGPGYDIEKDFRAREYLKQADPDRYDAYCRFVCDEVMPWAQTAFGLRNDPKGRTLFGFSNGGAFATTCIADRPGVFGSAIACSVAAFDRADLRASIKGKGMARLFLASGTLETFFDNTTDVETIFKESRKEVCFDRYVSGHDEAMWKLALATDLPKIFPHR